MINRQQHETTCAIVAVTNALKWLEKPAKYNDLLDYSIKKLGFKHNGTFFDDTKKLIKHHKIKHKIIKRPTFKEIEAEINQGRAVIILYKWCSKKSKRRGGHYSFITGYTDKFFIAWNDSRTNKTPYRSKKVLAVDFRYSSRWHSSGYPRAIVIM